MRTRPTTRALGLAALAGVLYWAAQPPVAASLLAFVALVPLLVAVRGFGPLGGLGLGWIAGTIACNGLTSASIFAALVHARHPAWLAVAEAFVVPQLTGAVWFAAFGAFAATLARGDEGGATRIVVLAAAWVAGELGRSRLGHGMPWVLLAHSQVDHPWMLQLADVAGAYGVSFVVALVNALGATLVSRPQAPRRLVRSLALAAIVLVATAVYGGAQLARWSAADGAHLDVVLVQGNVPETWRASLAGTAETTARYRQLVADAAASPPDLVILPENVVTVSAAANPDLLRELAQAAGSREVALIVGAPRDVALAPGRATMRNSAWLLDGAGTVRAVYDKRHLVPFGETRTGLVPAWLERRFAGADEYSSGESGTLFDVAGARIAILICWEAIYADAVRAVVRSGADVLVNLSNDDWFGPHAAREQHFRAALLRAVETRRFLVRVTNSGDTAIVDPRGVVVARAPRDAPAVLRGAVRPERELTVYSRYGDAFAAGCVVCALGALVPGHARRRAPDA